MIYLILTLVGSAIAKECIPGEFECEDNKMKMCSADGFWTKSDCPMKTKCSKTALSIGCLLDNKQNNRDDGVQLVFAEIEVSPKLMSRKESIEEIKSKPSNSGKTNQSLGDFIEHLKRNLFNKEASIDNKMKIEEDNSRISKADVEREEEIIKAENKGNRDISKADSEKLTESKSPVDIKELNENNKELEKRESNSEKAKYPSTTGKRIEIESVNSKGDEIKSNPSVSNPQNVNEDLKKENEIRKLIEEREVLLGYLKKNGESLMLSSNLLGFNNFKSHLDDPQVSDDVDGDIAEEPANEGDEPNVNGDNQGENVNQDSSNQQAITDSQGKCNCGTQPSEKQCKCKPKPKAQKCNCLNKQNSQNPGCICPPKPQSQPQPKIVVMKPQPIQIPKYQKCNCPKQSKMMAQSSPKCPCE